MPELRPYRRILALIDFDERDGATAEKALMLARLNRAELDFLHLIEPDGALDGGYPGGSSRADARELENAALRRLNFLAARIGAGEARCHAVYGPLRQGMLRHVRDWQPDLVVAGERHAHLGGRYDVLILSSPGRTGGGKWLANLLGALGSRFRTIGV